MLVARDSLTLDSVDKLKNQGYDVVVDADSEFVEVVKHERD